MPLCTRLSGEEPIAAYEELREQGFLGSHGVALVSTVVREELGRFPVLAEQDSDDVVQEFFVDRIQVLTVMLLAQATNNDSFGRLVRRTARNWLIDQARKTGAGALRRTIEKMLGESADFDEVPAGHAGAGRWRLVGTSGEPWGGDTGRLIAAAWAVPNVRVPKWSSKSRRPPIADRQSLVAIARAILHEAGGSLETAQIVHVFALRFAAALDPLEVSLDADSNEDADIPTPRGEPPSQELGPEDLVIAEDVALDVAVAAAEIVGRLSGAERALIPVLDDSSKVRERLGLGRSQSAHFASTLKAKIRSLAGTAQNRDEIVREVIALCGGPADS
jgi:hypothetical protein